MVDGSPASSTDPGTWAKFRDVQVGSGDGFGFMLGGGIGCYDLDRCVKDGVIELWASKFVFGLPEPVLFTEVSVSGTGLHVFMEAPEVEGTRLGNVERYTRARFIRCTGHRIAV